MRFEALKRKLDKAVKWAKENGWSVEPVAVPYAEHTHMCCCPFGALEIQELKCLPGITSISTRFPGPEDVADVLAHRYAVAFMHGFDSVFDDSYADPVKEKYRKLGRSYRPTNVRRKLGADSETTA